jgi:hypothetical protein
VVVFMGPSLPADDARALLEASYLPPAGRGDVYRVLSDGPQVIILLDGVFHCSPSVWQRELLDAIDDGVVVLGAASMGALRATELEPYGMIGCGRIFEWYRNGTIDGDDEVALLHGDAGSGFHPLSEPLVNIRASLSRAVREGCISSEQAEQLVNYAKQLHYPDRSYRRLLCSPVTRAWPTEVVARLETFLATRRVDLKRADALYALRYCRRMLADGSFRPRVASVPTSARGLWGPNRALLGGFPSPTGTLSGAEMLALARRNARLVTELRVRLARRFFVSEWAHQHHISCPPEALAAFGRRWASDHGVDRSGSWLRANGLTPAAYDRLLAERALVDWVARQGPTFFGLDDSSENEPEEARLVAHSQDEAPALIMTERHFTYAWGRDNGVVSDACLSGSEQDDLVDWMLEQGPSHFGLFWNEDLALLEELQIRGVAAGLVAAASKEGNSR